VSRDIGGTNETQAQSPYVHVVLLAQLEFDTPVYVHSGYGEIVYNSNTYLGVGDFGSMSQAKESEVVSPNSIVLGLSGVDSGLIAEALDSGAYGDRVTIYQGYRQDDGTLHANPWVLWQGFLEYATVNQGGDNTIALTCQSDLAVLNETDNSRYSDEDQVERYAGDRLFEYVVAMKNVKLQWGGRSVGTGSGGSSDGGGDFPSPLRQLE
jgi:hypothetical protein